MRSSGTMALPPHGSRSHGRNGCRTVLDILRYLYSHRYPPPLLYPPVPTPPSLVLPEISYDAAHSGPVFQYRHQFLNHHDLASLCGRKHHELFQPDGRPLHTELSSWGRRSGRRHCLHTRAGAGILRNTKLGNLLSLKAATPVARIHGVRTQFWHTVLAHLGVNQPTVQRHDMLFDSPAELQDK